MKLASTGHQAIWLRSFSGEIGYPINRPIPLCTDNQAVIFLTVNPAVECQTKHIDIQHHYICEQYENKGCRALSHSWRRKSCRLIYKVSTSCQGGKIQVQNQIIMNSLVEWEC